MVLPSLRLVRPFRDRTLCHLREHLLRIDRTEIGLERAIDGEEVLQKVVKLPITRWAYKVDRVQQHLGPVAQDFYAAFGLGANDKHIGTVDEEGVALAAIEGLDREVQGNDLRLWQALREHDALLGRVVQSKDARIEQDERKLAAARHTIADQQRALDAEQRQLRDLQQRVATLDRVRDEISALKVSLARLATQHSARASAAAWQIAGGVPSR